MCLCELYAIKIVLEMLFIHPSTLAVLCVDNSECRGITGSRGFLLSVQGRVNAACVEMNKCEQKFSNLRSLLSSEGAGTSGILSLCSQHRGFGAFFLSLPLLQLCCAVRMCLKLLHLSGIRMMST